VTFKITFFSSFIPLPKDEPLTCLDANILMIATHPSFEQHMMNPLPQEGRQQKQEIVMIVKVNLYGDMIYIENTKVTVSTKIMIIVKVDLHGDLIHNMEAKVTVILMLMILLLRFPADSRNCLLVHQHQRDFVEHMQLLTEEQLQKVLVALVATKNHVPLTFIYTKLMMIVEVGLLRRMVHNQEV
jgi:hypothetical protein